MTTVSVPAGTTIHCNRCDGAFALAKDAQRTIFAGTRAARLTCFAQCPHCGTSDKHWLNLIDAAPEFPGTNFQQIKARQAWAAAN